MIHAKIDEDGFLQTVRHTPTIAFQRLEYGYAVAGREGAYYAPMTHPGGGNLSDELFAEKLGLAFVSRMSSPQHKTLRPTTKPIPTEALLMRLRTYGGEPDPMRNYAAVPGDIREVIDSECQEVIRAIEEHERPDLRAAVEPALRDALSDALDLVMAHAESARELAEVGEWEPRKFRLHLTQSSRAMQTALELLLR